MKVALIIVFALAARSFCGLPDELIGGIQQMQKNIPNVDHYLEGCEPAFVLLRSNPQRSEIGHQSQVNINLPYLKESHQRKIMDHLNDLKFGKRVISMTFENGISQGVGGVIAKAFIGHRNNEQIVSIGVASSYSCNAKKQYATHQTQVCHKEPCKTTCHMQTTSVERGLNPQELNVIIEHLQGKAAAILLENTSAHLNLGGIAIDMNLQSLYIQEGQALRRFYPEIEYGYAEINDIWVQDLSGAIIDASQGQITDGGIINRIVTISSSASRSSFLYAPNDSYLVAISVDKNGDSFLLRQSTFRVNGNLPGGAFAVSVGSWSIERSGQNSNPGFGEIIQVFPPLK